MEPRPFSRGYTVGSLEISRDSIALQWSHGLSAVDTNLQVVEKRYHSLLQWSHGLSAVDTCQHKGPHPERFSILQWSHGLSAVDTPGSHKTPHGGYTFNGATAFQPWIPPGTLSRSRRATSFNGATAFQPWILCRRTWRYAVPHTFNGATAFQPWIRA